MDDIDVWHEQRGFMRTPRLIGRNQPRLKHIGYHFVIYTSGAVITGRGLEEVGAHARGHNARSIAICIVGKDKYSMGQWRALRENITSLQAQFSGARVIGHRDLSPDRNGDGVIDPSEFIKTCPGFDVATWLAGKMEPLNGHILEDPA